MTTLNVHLKIINHCKKNLAKTLKICALLVMQSYLKNKIN